MAPITGINHSTNINTKIKTPDNFGQVKTVEPILTCSTDALENGNKNVTAQNLNNTNVEDVPKATVEAEMKALVESYGIEWDKLKEGALSLFHKINPLKANLQEEEYSVSRCELEKIKQYIKQLIEVVINDKQDELGNDIESGMDKNEILKKIGEKITIDDLVKAHNCNILQVEGDFFNKDIEATYENIKDAGLESEIAVIAGCSIKKLRDLAKNEPEKVQKYIDIFVDAYKKTNCKEDATAVSIRNYARDNRILNDVGLTREQYEEYVKSPEFAEFSELLQGEVTEEKIQKLFENKMKQIMAEFETVKGTPEEKGFIEKAVNKQFKDFNVLLVSMDEKDRDKLIKGLLCIFAMANSDTLNTDNTSDTLNSNDFITQFFNTFDEERRIEIANNLSQYDKGKELLQLLNRYGCEDKGCDEAMLTISKNQSKSGYESNLKDGLEKFGEFTANPEAQEVLKKLKSGEKLTPEEQKIAEYFQFAEFFFSTNQLVAASVDFFKEDERQATLQEINIGLYNIAYNNGIEDFYNNVLNKVNDFITNNKDFFEGKNPEDIFDLINKATNGNLSIVASGSDAPLNPPKSTMGSASSDYGFVTSSSTTDNAERAAVLYQEIIKNSDTEDTPKFTIVKNNNSQTNSNNKETSDYSNINLREIQSGNINRFMASTGQSATKIIAIGIHEYKNISTSFQMWVQQKLKAMSDSDFAQAIYSASNNTKVDLIKETGKNPDDIDVVLDYSNRKQLEENSVA